MLVYIQSIIAILLGIVATITDFKDKKIYNKNVLIAITASILSYFIFYKQIETMYIKSYFVNLLISVVISFLFFYFKIWAAGDAKLFLALTIMIPFEIYEVPTTNVFPALYLLIMIFSTAFIYVVLETIILWIKDNGKFEQLKVSKLQKEELKEFLIQYFMGYFVILLINNISFRIFSGFITENGGLMLLCNMLILIFVYRLISETKKH